MLTKRQQLLLKILTETFIKQAKPVASKLLAQKMKKKISPATIRNEMGQLEKLDYIFQPHTSAGRIPTKQAYEFYIEHYLKPNKKPNKKAVKQITRLKKISQQRTRIKAFAKWLAEETQQAVLVAFKEADYYYTGLANLFTQPEFQDQDMIANISILLEHFDKSLKKIYHKKNKEPVVLIGDKSGFGEGCSLIVLKNKGILIGVLGPMRMNYQHIYVNLKFIGEQI